MKLTLLFPVIFSFSLFSAESAEKKPALTVEEKPRIVINDLPIILDDGLIPERRRTGEESGKIEKTLATKVRPAAYTGLAVAGMVATFPTPASIGFGIVAIINVYQGWQMNRKKKGRR